MNITPKSKNLLAVIVISLFEPAILHAQTLSFQQGFAGYTGSLHRVISSGNTNSNFTGQTVAIDLSTGDFGNSSGESQGLVRFDNIIGSGNGQVPPGVFIVSATLEIQTDNASNGPVSIYQMLTNWNEATVSWSSLNGGITPNDNEARVTADDTKSGIGSSDLLSWNVTKSVQSWVDGNPNYGWAFINQSSNGWDFITELHAVDSTKRPKLSIVYSLTFPDLYSVDVTNIQSFSATVNWKTTPASNSVVNYGLSPDALTQQVSIGNSVTNHSVPLTNLLPEATYYFEVISSDGGSFNASATGSFTTGNDPTFADIKRGPYLQNGNTNRITVRWRTDLPGDSVVHYGTDVTNLDQTVTVSGSRTNHKVPVTGLQPSTRYFYQIESNATNGGQIITSPRLDTFFDTAPPANTLEKTSIWVIGDSGTGNSSADGVYNGFQDLFGPGEIPQADVWLMLGDNAYDKGSDSEYQDAVFETYPELLRNTIVWPTLGNHDTSTNGGAPYLNIFTLPKSGEAGGVASGTERYYSFDYANIHFVCLDSETNENYEDTPGNGGMYDWLEADLQSCDKDWIIAFFHHGPYTKGSHDSDSESHHIQMRRHLVPLLEDYGVDLVLSGHSHQYERSRFNTGHHGNKSKSSTFNSDLVSDGGNVVDPGNGSLIGEVNSSGSFVTKASRGDGPYRKPLATANDGTVYAIAGASGKLSSWDNGSSSLVNPDPHPVHLVNLRLLGSLHIEVDGFTLNAQYIDSNGKVRDDFTVSKGSDFQITAPTPSTIEGGTPAEIQVTRSTMLNFEDSVTLSTSASDIAAQVPASLNFTSNDSSQSFQVASPLDNFAEGDHIATISLGLTRAVQPGAAQRRAFIPPTVASANLTIQDSPSQSWYFNNIGGNEITPADWLTDNDGDGLSRAFEALLGGSEGVSDFDKTPYPMLLPNTLELHFQRNTAITDFTLLGEYSDDLLSWSNTNVTLERTGIANPGGMEDWKATIPITPTPAEKEHFLRLRIEKLLPNE